MFLEISKDKSFDTLIKRVSLDENTKKLLGTSSRNEIIKSLVENMNSENIAIYRKLISKAEEEDREEQEAREEAEAAFSAQLGGQGSRGEGISQAGTDTEAYESEESEEVASSKFEYSRFKSVRQRYVTLKNALPALERLAKEIEIQPSTKSIHTSGYEFFNVDDYDGLIGKNMKKSNTIMDAMEIISESEKGLLDKTEYIKNGILVAISPPLRADRATGKPKRVKKLDDVDVQEIQTRLLEIMNNTYSVEGQEDMTFMDAFKNIHINTFKKTPTAKRDTKSYLSRVQRAFNKISEKEYDEMGSIMKGLQEVLKELEKLGKNDIRLVDKIAELEGYMKSDNLEDMIAYTINNLLSSLKEIKTTYYKETPTAEKKPIGQSVAYRRKEDPTTGKVGPEVGEILDQVEEISQNKEKYKDETIQTIQEELSENQQKLKEVRRDIKSLMSYVPFIEQTITIIRKFNRITKPDKSELARLESIVETLEEDDEVDNKELKNAKEQVALEEKSLERYFTLRKRIKQFDAMIGDIKDEFRNLNVLLEPIEEGNEKALQDLVSSISTMFMFTQKEKRAEAQSIVDEIKDESISEMNPRSRKKKYKKVTSVSMEQLDEMLEAADEAYEVVEKLAEKVNEMESLLSEIKG